MPSSLYSIAFGSDGSASASSVVGAAGTVDCDGDANADGADTLALMLFYYCCCNLPEVFFINARANAQFSSAVSYISK